MTIAFGRRLLAGLAIVGLVFGCAGPSGSASPSDSSSASASAPGSSSPGGSSGPSDSGSPSASASASPSGPPTKLIVGLGYIPSVQFAQFYLAQQAGYYRQAGLDVTFQNKIDPDLVTLTAQGAVDVSISDGTSVIPAVSQGLPIRYVATIYGTFPNIVFAKAASGITSVADLKGTRLGTPGKYGSSWIMLQALLKSAGLSPADLSVVVYPDYGQEAALEQGAVDAATGFTNNEPVQLELHGFPATVLHVDQVVPLPGPGLVVGTKQLASKTAALRAFVAATLRAMEAIDADPTKGLDASVAAVPALGQDRDTQLAILQATVATWQSAYTRSHGLGAIDTDAWSRSIDELASLPGGLVPNPVSVDDLISQELLP
ncbi:MAG TPA: ABC transporter substrate-binding protein [Candidatus Limnocylindrales bacterium]|nr:ABC transporter substrate-binding protein [Candidatus Limnocylindrales bacterium]